MNITLSIGGTHSLIGNDVPEFMGKVNENENRSKIHIGAESKDEAKKIFAGLSGGGQVEVTVDDSAVIELMGFLNPHLKNVEDFRHKLWDHLFLISDFTLDVESPYPIPTRETLKAKPERLRYPKRKFSIQSRKSWIRNHAFTNHKNGGRSTRK